MIGQFGQVTPFAGSLGVPGARGFVYPVAAFSGAYGVGEAVSLQMAVQGQLAKGIATGLANANAEAHPAEMMTGAANTAGAYYRAAYWLAVASRVARYKSNYTAAARLRAYAVAADAKATALIGSAYNPITWFWVSGNENPDDIAEIFQNAAMQANADGITDAAARLMALGSKASTAAQQAATVGSQPISDAPQVFQQAAADALAQAKEQARQERNRLLLGGGLALALLGVTGLVFFAGKK